MIFSVHRSPTFSGNLICFRIASYFQVFKMLYPWFSNFLLFTPLHLWKWVSVLVPFPLTSCLGYTSCVGLASFQTSLLHYLQWSLGGGRDTPLRRHRLQSWQCGLCLLRFFLWRVGHEDNCLLTSINLGKWVKHSNRRNYLKQEFFFFSYYWSW